VVAVSGPTVGRRRLRAELRRLRVDRELTQEYVAAEMEWSLSKLIRIENGTVAISVSDLRSLLAYYGIHDAQRVDPLLDLARAAKRRMWWDEYRAELHTALLTFVGFESEATDIGTFQPILLPGLVQTEAYTRALQRGLRPDLDEKQIDRRVEFRMRRQAELFKREDPPRFLAVLDESVLLRRPDPDARLMREQLKHLIEFAQQPYATIQVMPFAAGVHRGWDGNFTLMGFGSADDGVFYAQNNPSGDVLLWEEQAVAERFWQLLQTLTNRALSPTESIEFINRLV
jgi:transcriptional regulator with XRE-family HTH domain